MLDFNVNLPSKPVSNRQLLYGISQNRIDICISRDLPLWPETIDALGEITRKGKLVFYTSRGNPFVRTIIKTSGNGNSKYSTQNSITRKFSRLIKKAGLDVPKGKSFYTLRRTAATIAARSGDPFAVQRLLGHADLQMATRYVQDVSKQTNQVIENSRKYVIQEKTRRYFKVCD